MQGRWLLSQRTGCSVELPTEQPVHLTLEVQHLVWEVLFKFKQQVKLPVEQQSHLIPGRRRFKSNASCDSRGSPGQGHVGAPNQETQFTWELQQFNWSCE